MRSLQSVRTIFFRNRFLIHLGLIKVICAGHSSKKTARGLFRSLFCCFSKGQRSTNAPNGSSVTDGRVSPPVIIGSQFLLPPVRHQDMHKKCMVIDLDETLVHSSFKVRTYFTFGAEFLQNMKYLISINTLFCHVAYK